MGQVMRLGRVLGVNKRKRARSCVSLPSSLHFYQHQLCPPYTPKPKTPNSYMLARSLRSRLKYLTSITHSQVPLPISSSFSSQSSLKKKFSNHDTLHDDSSLFNRDPSSLPRLLVVQPRLRPPTFLQAKLNEALCLANSLEEQRDGFFALDFFDKPLPPHLVVQNPVLRSSRGRADTFFGHGTVGNIKAHLHAEDSKDEVDAVYVNAILTAIQQRNLEQALGKPVLDRVGLIIEIFNAHAHTKEAKLQAELAALMYKKTRLVRVRGPKGRHTFGEYGEAQVVSARGRGSGGQGFVSGAGETELQLQRRRIIEKRALLLSQIEEIRRTRAIQRAARQRHDGLLTQHLPTVAVVGYTNAGKSTLVSALSESDLYSDSRLFATLDCRLRSVILPSGRKVLLSDTVGFISDLPLQLVKAFHATLEEVVEADLLVYVIDCTAPNLDEHRKTVLQVLRQIGVSERKLQNMIEVWNKIDYEDQEDDEQYLNDGESDDAKASNFSGEEGDDVGSERSTRVENEKINGLSVADGGRGDLAEIIDEGQLDLSDGWLLSEDDQELVGDSWLETLDAQHGKASDDLDVKKKLSQTEHAPHVRTSAITGVGLQELLELIDERVKTRDEELKTTQQHVVERDIFNRKWRPPRTEDAIVT